MTILRGRSERAPFEADVDAVVVGSGAGGAVVARELARAGLSVVVIEEGGYYAPADYARFAPSTSLRLLMREAGLAAAVGIGDTPLVGVMAGRCVGGSSVLTGGVCFRVPDDVLHEWSTTLGLRGLAPEAMAPCFEEIERDLHVTIVPDHMRSRSTELFVEGAARLGIPMKPLARNAPSCKGAARCSFGCPNQAKMSVDVVMLPDARAHGAVVLSDARVERIEVEGGRARGVRGRFTDVETGRSSVPFHVRARVTVIACGSLHTPGLLRRSGLGGRHVGRHLTLHPAFRIGARFDERVDGWDGAMQSVYSDHFASEGLTLIGIYSAPSVLAATFPGVGREQRRFARALPHLAFFGAMIHDDPGGRVRHFPLLDRWAREPHITYEMSARDRARLWRGVEILGEMAFAAGAREVYLPVFGAPPLTRLEELRAFVESPPPARRAECMSFHPLGSARMSATAGDGVVAESGAVWGTEALYVADGSTLPSSIGVNSQLPIMANALRIARGIAERFALPGARAA